MASLEIKVFNQRTGAVTFHEILELADNLAIEAVRKIAQAAQDLSREATVTKTTNPDTGVTVIDIAMEGQPKISEPSFEALYRWPKPQSQEELDE